MKKSNSIPFSIVTVCLNPGRDLEKTVSSVFEQKFQNFELVIKDGCSTDGTQEKHWADNRVRFFSYPDEGIFDAMNQALELCRGNYVIFMNAGDYFADSEVLKSFADATENFPGVEFFYGDVFKHQGRAKINIYPDHLSRFFLFTRMICHQCWCVKRSVYLSYGGFETKFPIGGDLRLFIKMIAGDRLKYKHVRRLVACYEGGGQSSDPTLLNNSKPWENEIRQEFFSAFEYRVYSLLWQMWTTVKPVLYDHCLSWLWRLIQTRRNRNNIIYRNS